MVGDAFPEYYVSRPDSEDGCRVYYKIVSADGPVFWRRDGDETGRETTFYDFFLESSNGFGVNKLDKAETPWANG